MEHIFSKREALAFGWQQTKKHFVVLAGAVLLVTIIQSIVNEIHILALKRIGDGRIKDAS